MFAANVADRTDDLHDQPQFGRLFVVSDLFRRLWELGEHDACGFAFDRQHLVNLFGDERREGVEQLQNIFEHVN